MESFKDIDTRIFSLTLPEDEYFDIAHIIEEYGMLKPDLVLKKIFPQ